MVVMVVEMMMMMIPMKSSAMTMRMAMISPLREGISLADFSLPESFFSLCGFRLVEAAEYFLDGSPRLRVSGELSTQRGSARGGPGPYGVGPSWPISASPFGCLRHLIK